MPLNYERQCTIRLVLCHEYNRMAALLHPKCGVSLAHVASPMRCLVAQLESCSFTVSLNGIFTRRTNCGNTPPPVIGVLHAFNTEFIVQYIMLTSIMIVIRVDAHSCFDLPPARRQGSAGLGSTPCMAHQTHILYVIQIQELEALGSRP